MRDSDAPSPAASIDALVAAAIAAHARAAYLEAHELFEQAWRASGEPRSLELHALAQLEAALHKDATHGSREAARRILGRALEKLERLPRSSFGLDLVRLRADLELGLPGPEGRPPRLDR